EERRFIHMTHSEYAYWSWNGIYVFDHDLAGCTYQDDFVATAHMQNTTGDKWVEVGYVENETGSGSQWEVFIEGGISGNPTCGPTYSYLLDPDHYVTFKVTNIPGTTSFNFWVDYGSGWVFVGSCDNTFSHGWAFGETSRHGGTATGAKDDHRALHYKDEA